VIKRVHDGSRWIDVYVTFAGRGAMPHQERDAPYWRTKQNLTHYAPGRHDWLTPSDVQARKPRELERPVPAGAATKCGCGRSLSLSARVQGARWCKRCREKGLHLAARKDYVVRERA
jgi:hypothetical protein